MDMKIENGVLTECDYGETIAFIPDGVTKIGECAFSGCEHISSVKIPDGVTEIEEEAFYHCKRLESIIIPDSVTKIGNGAFLGCERLTSITIPNSITKIEDYVFAYCTDLIRVTIPESVTEIGKSAFESCRNLTSVKIPNKVTKISEDAFKRCKNLEEVITTDFDIKVYGSNRVNLQVCLIALKDFSVTIPEIKYDIIWQMFMQKPDDEDIFAYVNKNFMKMIKYAIDIDEVEIIKAICKRNDLPTKKNIGKIIEYADIERRYGIIWQMLIQMPNDENVFAYVKENFIKMMNYAINNNDFEVITAVCKRNDLITHENIGKIIEYATIDRKYDIVWHMFMQMPNNEDIFSYVKKKIIKMMNYAIDNNDFEIITAVCKRNDLLTQENIGKIIEYTIELNNFEIVSVICKRNDLLTPENTDKIIKYAIQNLKSDRTVSCEIKYDIIWQMFIQKPDDEDIFAYVKKNLIKMLKYAIDENNVEIITAVCKKKDLLTKRNIDKIIEHAIQHTQNGGTVEIQAILMRYKNDNIGFSEPDFSI